MTKASDNEFPSVLFEDQASTPTTPAAGFSRVFTKSDGAYVVDDAGAVTGPFGAGGGGTEPAGNVLVGMPLGLELSDTGGSFDNVADRARLMVVNIPGAMLVRELLVRCVASAAGTVEWGLFDYSSNSAACTKLAGGSGALGSTGWISVAATSAPVSVAKGNYVLIVKLPAATPPSVRRSTSGGAAGPFTKIADSYTWDDTPDITPGGGIFADSTVLMHVLLIGDLDGSNQW